MTGVGALVALLAEPTAPVKVVGALVEGVIRFIMHLVGIAAG